VKFLNKTLCLGLACMALSACGGTGGSASAAPTTTLPTTPTASDGLGGTPGQPFAQRLSQTAYPKSLVNDPEAMKRILGEDKDSNGIRDDVDALIGGLAKNPGELKAFQQYARGMQQKFSVTTKEQAYLHQDQMTKAIKCGRKTFEEQWGAAHQHLAEYDRFSETFLIIAKSTVNSTERMLRSNEVAALKHGASASFDPSEDVSKACD
jgi:hypothetical protein